ncbi:MAG: phospholipid:lipid A palmitoyltransferase [Burkholderiales bacterium]
MAGAMMAVALAPIPFHCRAEEESGLVRRTVARLAGEMASIYREGRTDLYLSGYYWHLPFAYSEERRRELNDRAFGFGLGRTLIDARGNERGLFATASRSSHFKPQYAAGYLWLARWPLIDDLHVGAGFAAFIFARSDIYHYFPLPGIVPIGSVGTGRAALYVTYLPHISNGITGRGNVIYAFARLGFD